MAARVEPIHVGGRVGLGESEFLRLGEGLTKRLSLDSSRQDEVRRPLTIPITMVMGSPASDSAQAVDDGHGSATAAS